MKSAGNPFLFGTLIAIATQVFGVWSEAASDAAGIGFAETVGYHRLARGLGEVGFDQIRSVRLMEWEYLAILGMIVFLLLLMARGAVSKWIAAVYLTALVASGGWIGLMLLPYLPFNLLFHFNTLDGEAFEEGIVRMMFAGLWPWLVLIWTLGAFINWRPGFMRSTATGHRSV